MTRNLQSLIEDLGHANISVQLNARTDLLELGSLAVDPLIEVLQTGAPRQVTNAIVVLSRLRDRRGVQPLIRQLQADGLMIRLNAAKALGDLGDRRAVIPLIQALGKEHDIIVTTWLVLSLGKLGDQRAVEPLIALLNSTPSASLQYTIIRALGDLGDRRAIDHIRAFINNPDHHIRKHTRAALSKLGVEQ